MNAAGKIPEALAEALGAHLVAYRDLSHVLGNLLVILQAHQEMKGASAVPMLDERQWAELMTKAERLHQLKRQADWTTKDLAPRA